MSDGPEEETCKRSLEFVWLGSLALKETHSPEYLRAIGSAAIHAKTHYGEAVKCVLIEGELQ